MSKTLFQKIKKQRYYDDIYMSLLDSRIRSWDLQLEKGFLSNEEGFHPVEASCVNEERKLKFL